MKKYLISIFVLLGISGCDLPLPTYKLKSDDKVIDTYATKEECEKKAITMNTLLRGLGSSKRAKCHISFF